MSLELTKKKLDMVGKVTLKDVPSLVLKFEAAIKSGTMKTETPASLAGRNQPEVEMNSAPLSLDQITNPVHMAKQTGVDVGKLYRFQGASCPEQFNGKTAKWYPLMV